MQAFFYMYATKHIICSQIPERLACYMVEFIAADFVAPFLPHKPLTSLIATVPCLFCVSFPGFDYFLRVLTGKLGFSGPLYTGIAWKVTMCTVHRKCQRSPLCIFCTSYICTLMQFLNPIFFDSLRIKSAKVAPFVVLETLPRQCTLTSSYRITCATPRPNARVTGAYFREHN